MQRLKRILKMWKRVWSRAFFGKTESAKAEEAVGKEEDAWDNPFIDDVRELLLEVLTVRGDVYKRQVS